MLAPRRFLGMPHRALRYLRVRWIDAAVGLLALIVVAVLAWLVRAAIWQWQFATWRELASLVGIHPTFTATEMRWEQEFLIPTARDVLLTTAAFLLACWLVLKSTFPPAVKALFLVITLPFFLYNVVVWIHGHAALATLARTSPDWLIGEICLWCLIALLWAVFVFPVPVALLPKLISLVGLLGISIVWRTVAPFLYMTISVYTHGTFAIQAWMTLGPWMDFIYIVPFFSTTLALHKGGRLRDYRA